MSAVGSVAKSLLYNNTARSPVPLPLITFLNRTDAKKEEKRREERERAKKVDVRVPPTCEARPSAA